MHFSHLFHPPYFHFSCHCFPSLILPFQTHTLLMFLCKLVYLSSFPSSIHLYPLFRLLHPPYFYFSIYVGGGFFTSTFLFNYTSLIFLYKLLLFLAYIYNHCICVFYHLFLFLLPLFSFPQCFFSSTHCFFSFCKLLLFSPAYVYNCCSIFSIISIFMSLTSVFLSYSQPSSLFFIFFSKLLLFSPSCIYSYCFVFSIISILHFSNQSSFLNLPFHQHIPYFSYKLLLYPQHALITISFNLFLCPYFHFYQYLPFPQPSFSPTHTLFPCANSYI